MKKRIKDLRGAFRIALGKALRRISENKFGAFIAALALLLLVLFTDQIKAFLILSVLGVASSLVAFYKRIIRMPPVLELISLTTVVITLVFGPIVAIIYVSIVTLAAEVFSGYPDVMTLTYLPTRAIQVLSVVAMANFTDMGIVEMGFWSVVTFNIVEQPIFMLLTDTEQRLKALYFTVLNIPLNFFIFRILAEPLYAVLSLIA